MKLKSILLRILSGPQAGASLCLEQRSYTMAAASDYDICIREPLLEGTYLTLHVSNSLIRLTPYSDLEWMPPGVDSLAKAGETYSIKLGHAFIMGQTELVFTHVDDTLDSIKRARAVKLSRPQFSISSIRIKRIFGSGVLILILSLLFVYFKPKQQLPVASTHTPNPLHEIWPDGVDIVHKSSPGSPPRLIAYVRNEKLVSEIRRLAALRHPNSKVNIITDAFLMSKCKLALHSLAPETQVTVKPYGEIILSGVIPKHLTIEAIKGSLTDAIPHITQIQSQMIRLDQVRQDLQRALNDAGLQESLYLEESDDQITIQGVLTAEQSPLWIKIKTDRVPQLKLVTLIEKINPELQGIAPLIASIHYVSPPFIRKPDRAICMEGGVLTEGIRLVKIYPDYLVLEHRNVRYIHRTHQSKTQTSPTDHERLALQ